MKNHYCLYTIIPALRRKVNISVINPFVVKSLIRVEGKPDKGDALDAGTIGSKD